MIEMLKEDKKQKGRMSGKIGLGGRLKLKRKDGWARRNGKIDYRGIIDRRLGREAVVREVWYMGKGGGRGVRVYLGICFGRSFLSLFWNGGNQHSGVD